MINQRFIFFLLVAVLPAWVMNRYLMKWVRPRGSMKRFLLYLLLIVSFAFAYTFIVCWILLKYVWPVK